MSETQVVSIVNLAKVKVLEIHKNLEEEQKIQAEKLKAEQERLNKLQAERKVDFDLAKSYSRQIARLDVCMANKVRISELFELTFKELGKRDIPIKDALEGRLEVTQKTSDISWRIFPNFCLIFTKSKHGWDSSSIKANCLYLRLNVDWVMDVSGRAIKHPHTPQTVRLATEDEINKFFAALDANIGLGMKTTKHFVIPA